MYKMAASDRVSTITHVLRRRIVRAKVGLSLVRPISGVKQSTRQRASNVLLAQALQYSGALLLIETSRPPPKDTSLPTSATQKRATMSKFSSNCNLAPITAFKSTASLSHFPDSIPARCRCCRGGEGRSSRTYRVVHCIDDRTADVAGVSLGGREATIRARARGGSVRQSNGAILACLRGLSRAEKARSPQYGKR